MTCPFSKDCIAAPAILTSRAMMEVRTSPIHSPVITWQQKTHQIQYGFSNDIAKFSLTEFYSGRLRSGLQLSNRHDEARRHLPSPGHRGTVGWSQICLPHVYRRKIMIDLPRATPVQFDLSDILRHCSRKLRHFQKTELYSTSHPSQCFCLIPAREKHLPQKS